MEILKPIFMKTIKQHFKARIVTLLGILLMVCPLVMNAQTKSKKVKSYNVWIKMIDHSKEKGILYAADETYIKIAKNRTSDDSNVKTIDPQTIDVIKIRRKGKVGNGALIGGLSGIGLSAIIGVSSDEGFFSKEESAAIAGILFVPLGTGIGALTGSKSEMIEINGNLNNYLNWLKLLQSYALNPTGNP